jgi:glycosyltransferase involved in cell wall biosynthesis
MIASVVIPAHDEEVGLQRCLTSLLAEASPDEFDVVVVPNGCSDRTADVARSFADRGVRCVETADASKIVALRLGDAAAQHFPRIYLDADVVVTTRALRAVVSALRSGGQLAAAPRLTLDLRGCTRWARAYLSVWQDLPVFGTSYVGSGCYALAEEGRARFSEFPDVMSDDQFVNDLFRPSEKVTLTDQPLGVLPARTLRSIVRRSLRVRAGRLDLPGPVERAAVPSTRTHLLTLGASSPVRLPAIAVFCATQVFIIVTAEVRRRRGTDRAWLRDETSRTRVDDADPGSPRH